MIEKAPNPKINQEEKETLSFKEAYPIIDLYRKAPDKAQFMAAMKKNGISIGGENITPIDFFATSSDLGDEEILEAIAGYLGVEKLDSKIDLINESLDKAKDYIENYLHLSLPNEIKNLDEIKDLNDILKIFKKQQLLKKGKALDCRLLIVFLFQSLLRLLNLGKESLKD